MFLGMPHILSASFRQTVLILNTVLLILALVTFELVYADVPRNERKQLPYAYPILITLCAILALAVYLAVRSS